MHLILAPHVDDEVIGCFTLLQGRPQECVVAYCSPVDPIRLKEARKASKKFNFTMKIIGKGCYAELSFFIDEMLDSYNPTTIWAPDPLHELHPLHKMVGALGYHAAQAANIDFGVYSTNMNAPYIRELLPVQRDYKRNHLNLLYKSQKSLWEHDHRYFLFEGRALWNPPA